MTDTDSIVRRAAVAAWLVLTFIVPAAAQQTFSSAPTDPGFLTRYDFHLSGVALSIDDPRFSWDTHFGGDLDILDYVVGRTSIAVDYEAVLGDQLRIFDPNQGNYILEASSSARAGRVEIVGVFHHVSRHLSDRPKVFAIAWNTFGARVLGRWEGNGTTLDVNVDGAKVVAHAFVDYAWVGQADVQVRHAIAPSVDAFVHGKGQLFGIDEGISTRTHQAGGLVEAGVRLKGLAGVLELFTGYERRVDADPIDLTPQHWGMAGFRLVNR